MFVGRLFGLRKVLDVIERIAMILAVLCIIAMLAVVTLQVYSRVFLPSAPAWTEELSRMIYVHVVGFAAPIALRQDKLMAVDFIFASLSPLGKIIQRLISRFIIAATCIVFAYLSYGFFINGFREVSGALRWTMAIPFSSLFICGVLSVVFSIENTVKDVKSVITRGELSS